MTTGVDKMATLNELKKEWPYVIKLIRLDETYADSSYQRPPQTAFIAKMVNSFDDTLVGVIDVSDRTREDFGGYAILDGLQRTEAIRKVGKQSVWAAIYHGMTVAEEAMFFYRKNKDRRNVHPYYSFRARSVAGDRDVREVFRIIEAEAYKLGTGAIPDDTITAIRACEEAYNMESAARKESLSPAIHVLRRAFYGREGGKDGELIRGLGRFFQPFVDEEIDFQWLEDKLAAQNPRAIIGRARDKYHLGQYRSNPVAEEIVRLYNLGRRQGKLSRQMLTKTKK